MIIARRLTSYLWKKYMHVFFLCCMDMVVGKAANLMHDGRYQTFDPLEQV
jgi:hypothetical protein